MPQPLLHVSGLGFATPEVRADRTSIAAPETTRRPRGLRNEIVSGLGRLYGTSETRPKTEVPERLGDSASQGSHDRHPLPSRDRSVETLQTRYETLGRPRGRRGVSGAAMSLRCTPTSSVASPERRCVEGWHSGLAGKAVSEGFLRHPLKEKNGVSGRRDAGAPRGSCFCWFQTNHSLFSRRTGGEAGRRGPG